MGLAREDDRAAVGVEAQDEHPIADPGCGRVKVSIWARPVRSEVRREMPALTKEHDMPQYLLSVHSVDDEATEPMTDEQMQEFMRGVGELEREMNAAGALVYSGRLADVDTATVVRAQGGETLITDGPFAEAKEHLGGFYIVNANDLDEALSWAAKTSACVARPIEVRPFFEMPGT
jgi:hypothetical protein